MFKLVAREASVGLGLGDLLTLEYCREYSRTRARSTVLADGLGLNFVAWLRGIPRPPTERRVFSTDTLWHLMMVVTK